VEKYRVTAAWLGLKDEDAIEEGEWMPVLHLRHLHVRRRRLQSVAV